MRARMPQHQVGSRLDLGGSCGGPVCVRWRAEKQLSRWKAFDEVHGSAAERALRKDYGWLGLVGGLFNSRSDGPKNSSSWSENFSRKVLCAHAEHGPHNEFTPLIAKSKMSTKCHRDQKGKPRLPRASSQLIDI